MNVRWDDKTDRIRSFNQQGVGGYALMDTKVFDFGTPLWMMLASG